MKLSIVILFLNSLNLFSQILVESNFNRNATSNNQTLTINYKIRKFTFGIGIKYLFNKRDNFPNSVIYKRTYWALENKQHFGINGSFQFEIWKLSRNNLSLFYDFQYTKSTNRFETFYAHEALVPEPQSEYDYSYIKHTAYFQPVLGFENNIGLQFQFYLTKNFYLNQRAGVGVLFYKELDPNVIIIGDGRGWVFSEMLSVGLGWKFNDKEK